MRYPLITFTFLAVNLTIHAITARKQTVDVTLGKAESFSQSLYTFNTDMATVMFASLVEHRDAIEIATFHWIYDSVFNAFFIDDKTNRVETNASYELFRRRPDLQFGYPPYANPQPMFDADGNNTVNLCECNGKTLAVSNMKLASPKLIAGRDFTSLRYTFQFDPSSNDRGVTIVFPEDAITKSSIIRFRNFSIVATP